MIEFFESQAVCVTWATVGALFCESKDELLERLPQSPAFVEPRLGIWHHLSEIGNSERDDPLHFAPSLIRELLASDFQEVGTHTFAHLYALEGGVKATDIKADLMAAKTIATAWGASFDSIVFPRNQYDERVLDVCQKVGIKAFRGNSPLWAWQPGTSSETGTPLRRVIRLADALVPIQPPGQMAQVSGMVNVPATLFLRPEVRQQYFSKVLVNRVKAGMTSAARNGGLFHLWWHPHNFGVGSDACMNALRTIIAHYKILQEEFGMENKTMATLGARWD